MLSLGFSESSLSQLHVYIQLLQSKGQRRMSCCVIFTSGRRLGLAFNSDVVQAVKHDRGIFREISSYGPRETLARLCRWTETRASASISTHVSPRYSTTTMMTTSPNAPRFSPSPATRGVFRSDISRLSLTLRRRKYFQSGE